MMRSLLLSICFHLGLLSLFIFTFPIIPEAQKPKLFFLGSLLRTHTLSEDILDNNVLSKSQNFDYQQNVRQKSPFGEVTLEKPKSKISANPPQKSILKSTFETSLSDDKSVFNPQTTDLEIDTKTTPYSPLKLDTLR